MTVPWINGGREFVEFFEQAPPKTWTDLERLSLLDPFVHRMFAFIERGMSREDALIATVCALSDIRQRLIDAEVRRRMFEQPKWDPAIGPTRED